MQAIPNGIHHAPYANGNGNGNGHDTHLIPPKLEDEPSQEELEAVLPDVFDGQISLGELLSRISQSIYAELTDMADTLPGMSDAGRKRKIADWVVKTKKQVVKLYAIMKWSRDATSVQKAMNITAFLMDHGKQFTDSIHAISTVKEGLAPARLRNHDLLTSLDVLTTGTYQRLPSQIKKFFIQPDPLSDDEVNKTLKDMDFLIRYRLRMKEFVPTELATYRVGGGRAFFTVTNLFKVSISLRGALDTDGWFLVNVEFLHHIGGELEEVQDFPSIPTGSLKNHITFEADARLNYYTPVPVDSTELQQPVENPDRPQLHAGVVDAPIVRLFNFLQMMSLTYQLEILFYQASRLRSLGWQEYLSLKRGNDGKSFVASYWLRPNQPEPPRAPGGNRTRIAPMGGTITVSLLQTRASDRAGGGPSRSPRERVLNKLALVSRATDSATRLSDDVETFRLEVKWEPSPGALGVEMPIDQSMIIDELTVNPLDLNFEALLQTAVRKHIDSILIVYQQSLIHGPFQAIFDSPGEISLSSDNGLTTLRIHLYGDEVVVVSIDPRTGRITLRDTGELAAASGRGPRFAYLTERINQNPLFINDAIIQLKYNTIVELAEQKAHYLGLQTFRSRNFSLQEYAKFGPDARLQLFIQLSHSPSHYLVVVITDLEFRFALISTQVQPNNPTGAANTTMEDIGWLDVKRIHEDSRKDLTADDVTSTVDFLSATDAFGTYGELELFGLKMFKLDTELLRELYAYCCARVAYTKVELQLKLRGIPYTYLDPIQPTAAIPDPLVLRSTLTRSVPGLCVQSSDILAGAPAAEAAMPNIRVIPLNWWSTKKSQVVTCVKLKYVQQPVGKRAAASSAVIRPSKRILYDTREAVVSFLSENVDTCVDEFLEEWAKVSKIVVIAREVAQMATKQAWDDVRLLSFDLQTVAFTYAKDYTVSITCTDQLLASTSSGSSYELSFARLPPPKRKSGRFLKPDIDPFAIAPGDENEDALENPHEDAEPFLRNVLRQGPRLSSSLHQLVSLLRDSLPVACVLDSMRKAAVSGKDTDGLFLGVDAFPKSAGWYRILYGDMRHALDFRLLSNRRVAILDAAYNGTSPIKPSTSITNPSTPSLGHKSKPSTSGLNDNSAAAKKHVTFAGLPEGSAEENMGGLGDVGLLQPIPEFASLVKEAALEAVRTSLSSKPAPVSALQSKAPIAPTRMFRGQNVALLDVGLVCHVDDVEILAPQVHARIVKSLARQKQKSKR